MCKGDFKVDINEASHSSDIRIKIAKTMLIFLMIYYFTIALTDQKIRYNFLKTLN